MKYKAVIFDLDGTILYTLGDIARIVNSVLLEMDMPSHPELSYKKFVGHGLKETLRRACSKECPEESLNEGYLRVIEEYSNNPVKDTKLYKGIHQLLDSLLSMGIKLAILSNKEDKLVKFISAELLSSWPFITIRGLSPDFPKKPDPFMVHQILKNMDVKPEETVFVGDSEVDMKTAVNSGLLGVGVSWGYRDIIELTESGAGILIDKPEELLKIINSKQ
jgi:phosphoglycolate phosphatase